MNVDIYGITYEIKEIAQDELQKKFDNTDKDKQFFGGQFPFEQEILLAETAQNDSKRVTLIHELAHAIIFVLGYGKLDEENVCDFMGAHHNLIQNILEKYFK